MSPDESTSDDNASTREIDESGYGDMLDDLDVAIDECRRKIQSGRVYDSTNEKVRIKWVKALAYTMNVRRQVKSDAQLTELSERIERLEEARENDAVVAPGVGAEQ